MPYVPPFTVSPESINLVAEIAETMAESSPAHRSPKLRRINRIRSIQSSLAIENNTLTLSQITDVIDGRRIIGPPDEILEAKNAFRCYSAMQDMDPHSESDLLGAHGMMMDGLMTDAGAYRRTGVGVYSETELVHMAPPADMVPQLMNDLFRWMRDSADHPLIKGCVFHYEFEFIHPFSDGNGRTGRFWHSLILSKWNSGFQWVPVESVVRRHQQEYYAAIGESTANADSGPFIEFMLRSIREAVSEACGVREPREFGLSRTEAEVLALIENGMYATAKSCAEQLCISPRAVERAIRVLRENGLIERTGSDKRGRWIPTLRG